MSSKIIEITNALPDEKHEELLSYLSGLSHDDWIELADDDPTSKFWNKKECIVSMDLCGALQEAIFDLKLAVSNFSAVNKMQRFFNLDKVGPTLDINYVPDLKVSLVYFINDPAGSGIEFPNMEYKVKAVPNKLVAYPSNELYTLSGPTNGGGPLYFSTVYGD